MYLNHNQTDPSYQNAHPIIYWIVSDQGHLIEICMFILLILLLINKITKNKTIQKISSIIAPISFAILIIITITLFIHLVSRPLYERTITYNGNVQIQSIDRALNDDLTKTVTLKQNGQTRITHISNDKLKHIKPNDHVKITIKIKDNDRIQPKDHIKFSDMRHIGSSITNIEKIN